MVNLSANHLTFSGGWMKRDRAPSESNAIWTRFLSQSPGSVLWSMWSMRGSGERTLVVRRSTVSRSPGGPESSVIPCTVIGSSPPKLLGNNPVRPAPNERRHHNPNHGKSDKRPSFNDYSCPVDVSLHKYPCFHWMNNVVEENKSSVCVLTPRQSRRDLSSTLKALVYFFD